MKKILFILSLTIIYALSGCNSENTFTEDMEDLYVGMEESSIQAYSSSDRSKLPSYPFINIMVGEDITKVPARTAFLQSDGEFLLKRTKVQKINDIERLKSLFNDKDAKALESEYYERLLNLYGAEKFVSVKRILTSYANGDDHALSGLQLLSLTTPQREHVEVTVKYIDNVVKPFGKFALNKSFDSATTHEECYDAAVEAVMGLGLDFAIGTLASGGGLSLFVSAYTAFKLYMIYLAYDDCLERVNGGK